MSFRLTHMTALWRRSLACRYPALLSRSRAALRHVPADAATRKFALKTVRCARSCSTCGPAPGAHQWDVTSSAFDISWRRQAPNACPRRKSRLK